MGLAEIQRAAGGRELFDTLVRTLFQAPTVAELASLLRTSSEAESGD